MLQRGCHKFNFNEKRKVHTYGNEGVLAYRVLMIRHFKFVHFEIFVLNVQLIDDESDTQTMMTARLI